MIKRILEQTVKSLVGGQKAIIIMISSFALGHSPAICATN